MKRGDRMKVLQVNSVYKRGSTGKIVYDIHKFLQEEGIESVVCYGRGQKENEFDVYKTSSEKLAKYNALRARVIGLQYNGSWIATNKLIKVIEKEQPDIVHLHCINGNFVNIYRLLDYLKVKKIKTVLTLHAEFMYTGNCGHAYECEKWKTGCGKCPQLWHATNSYWFDRTNTSWELMKSAFEGFDDNLIVTSVSPWLMARAKQSAILGGKEHVVVLNGIDTKEVFHPSNFEYLREKHGLTDEKIILHVTANFTNEIKGGKYVRQLAEKLKDKNIKIIIIGNTDKKLNLPTNIIDIGRIFNQKELAAFYSLADLTILTSSRETFSMVCAESLACGTPIVGFKAGAPEQISLTEFSEFVDYGDLNALEDVVLRWIGSKKTLKDKIANEANKKYSKVNMVEKYIDIYKRLLC
jgi:putative colanic acid biosynthesis glycosyltransferase